MQPVSKIAFVATSEWTLLHSDFSMQKNQSHAPSFLLYRKKAHSARLFACKRSQRLTAATTFLRAAPAAQIPRQVCIGFFNWKGLEPCVPSAHMTFMDLQDGINFSVKMIKKNIVIYLVL